MNIFSISDSSDENPNFSNDTSTVSTQLSPCEKAAWKVNFADMGWHNFIISPKEISTHDCMGECSNGVDKSIPNHLKLMRILRKRSGCCIPTKYGSIPIMFYDKFDNIVIKTYNNIIVKQCGCR